MYTDDLLIIIAAHLKEDKVIFISAVVVVCNPRCAINPLSVRRSPDLARGAFKDKQRADLRVKKRCSGSLL